MNFSSTQTIPIFLYIVASLFGAVGQLFYKWGAQGISEGRPFNLHLLFGVICFLVVMVFFVLGFKLGGRLSVIYPFYGLTFIWGALLGKIFEKEPIHFGQSCGILVMILGLGILNFFKD